MTGFVGNDAVVTPIRKGGPVACIVPAYNAGSTIAAVVAGLRESLPEAWIIGVNDGSRDATGAIARERCDATIEFDRNRGKGIALRAGFEAALDRGASVVITIDADGQHATRLAPALVTAIETADIAIGARARAATPMPFRRRVTNALSSAAIASIAGVRLADTQSGFRAIRRAVLERVRAVGDRYDFETDFIIRAALAGFRIVTVEVPTIYGAPSHFRGVRDSMRVVGAIWRHRAGASR